MFIMEKSRGRYWRPDGTEVLGGVSDAAAAIAQTRPCDLCGGTGLAVLMCTEKEEGRLYIGSVCEKCLNIKSRDELASGVTQAMERLYPKREELPFFRFEEGLVLRLMAHSETLIQKMLRDRPVKIEGQLVTIMDPEPIMFDTGPRTYIFFREFMELMVIEFEREWTDTVLYQARPDWDDYHQIIEALVNPGRPFLKDWAQELVIRRVDEHDRKERAKKMPGRDLLGALAGLTSLLGVDLNEDGECQCDSCTSKREASKDSAPS